MSWRHNAFAWLIVSFVVMGARDVLAMVAQLLMMGAGPATLVAQAEGVPVGAIVFIKAGTCPTGYDEDTDVNGKTVLGTLAANGNVGGTGGSDNITPAGTNSGGAVSAHSGTAVAAHASHTHTYTEVPNHVHLLTAFPTATGGSSGFTVDTSMSGTPANNSLNTANPTGGVATGTTAGPSASLTHTVTQPDNHTFTQPTFAGSSFDNRSSFIRLIACRKT